MAVLRTLPGRIKTLNTRRVNVLKGEQRRVSGSARVSLKRRIWLRDAGQCCLCGRVVDLCDSELDHRIALQFGGGNEETNLWTLCTECHRQKSVSETASGMPDPTLPEVPDVMSGPTVSLACDPPWGGSSGEKKRSPWTPRPLSRREKIPVSGQLTC
ncbi:HNH endonuclease family protein [Escherichia coli DEC4D]|nr:HNH endonuclease family protein [Escherichia coli DEC4D]